MNIFSKIFDKFNQKELSLTEQVLEQLRQQPNKMFMGSYVNPIIVQDKFNIVPFGHSLWAGNMGSGKSVAGFSSVLFHTLTHPNDLIIVVDKTKGGSAFKSLSTLKRVLPIFNGDEHSLDVIINFLYIEILARREQSYTCPHNIIVVIEDQHAVNQLLQYSNQFNPSSSFLKLKQLMSSGSRYGIYFYGFYQDVSPSSSLPSDFLNLYDYRHGFSLNSASAQILNIPEASNIDSSQKGFCYNQQTDFLTFPNLSYTDGVINPVTQLITEELVAKKNSNNTPNGLLTAPEGVLAQLKEGNNLIFNRYSLFLNHKYLDPKFHHLINAPVEDLSFWDFINLGPVSLKK